MPSFQNLIITDAGLALMADLVDNEDSIRFTKVSIGDGTYSAGEKTAAALKVRTALKSQKQTYDLSYIESTAANQVRLQTLLSNYDPSTHTALFEEGFYVNELGVFARPSSSGSEVLYAITVTTQAQGDYLPHYDGDNPIEMVQDITVAINNDLTVEVVYSESAFALAQSLSDHSSSPIGSQLGAHGLRYYDDKLQYSTTAYSEVTPAGTENPKERGWYVLVDGEYELTTDETVVAGTTYYSATTTWHTIPTGGSTDIVQLYDLRNTTTTETIVSGNNVFTEVDHDLNITSVATVVKTSDTLTTVTTVITPDDGDIEFVKTETITKTAGGRVFDKSFIIRAKS